MIFSIVTVSYNAGQLIEQTINSVVNQTFTDYEYLIIDGLSTDNTVEIIKRYSENISYWISERDDGVYNAMNKAITKCSGKWILFLNAGDVFTDQNVLSNISKYCDLDVDFICGNRHRVNIHGHKFLERAGPLKESYFKEVVFHQSLFTRRTLFSLRPYNEAYKLAADYEYVLYAIKKNCRFKFVNVCISDFLEGGLSRQNYLLAQIEAIKASLHFIPKDTNIKSNFYLENLVLQNMGYYINKTLQANLVENPKLKLTVKQKNNGVYIFANKGNNELKNLLGRINAAFNNMSRINTFESLIVKVIKNTKRAFKRSLNKSNRIINNAEDKKNDNRIESNQTHTNLSDKRVSIVTVCYNAADTLMSTIESVLNQNFKNLEYIIIDGNSTDNTAQILASYQKRITKIIIEEDEGLYYAMNKAINYITGDYVLYLNAGDCLHDENILNNVFNNRNQLTDLIYGARLYKKSDGSMEYQPARNLDSVFYRMPYCHQSLFLKSSILKKTPFNTTYKYAADYEQSVRLFLNNCTYTKIDAPVCIFSEGGASESGIRPYIETIKVLFDYCENTKVVKKSHYYSAFTRNINTLLKI